MLNGTEHKIIILINVQMPTIVRILAFYSMINTPSKSLKARKIFIFQYFSFYEHLKFHAKLSWPWKMFVISGPAFASA